MKKVRAEAENGFDLDTVRAQVEKSFKQAEQEMSNNVRIRPTIRTIHVPTTCCPIAGCRVGG